MKLYDKRFTNIKLVGEGSYGKVYKVELKTNPGEVYAIKKFKYDDKSFGIDYSGLREISILKEFNHENIEKIIDTFGGIDCLYIQFEFIDYDIEKLYKNARLNESILKNIMKQLLFGLSILHKNGVLHRDLAIKNILINKKGVLKIADFGMARFMSSPGKPMTRGVTTLMYRAPEIFYGAKYYSYGVDVWSAGCIFGELLIGRVLFDGREPIEVVKKIFHLLGVPNETNWPDWQQLDKCLIFKQGDVIGIKNYFNTYSKFQVSDECLNLLERMLVLDPNKRITAEECLNHPFFTTDPLPCSNEVISKIIEGILEKK